MSTTHSIEVLRLELLAALKGFQKQTHNPPLADISDKLAKLTRAGSSLEKEHDILQSLSFSTMRWRYSNIKKEHEQTFQWIFKGPDTQFLEWLRTGAGIYWIEGKAGSGKSTLMKYIVNADHTHMALNAWAGHRDLVMASYFFWAAGTSMQRSLEGFLRTILFQVLGKCPNLIANVCPKRWDHPLDPFRDWEHDELVLALDLVAKQAMSHTRFCFFVDGMDECTGDQRALVQLLKVLAACPSIKLCISSRPWNVFVNAFDGKVPQLKLETLTKGDIQKYVDDKLNAGLSTAGDDARTRKEVAAEISTRARGVFLWVYLVVDSLLRGREEGDDIEDMRRRLDALPDDLEEFFKRIMSTIDKVYREQTAKIFLIMIDAENSLPALSFSYLEKEETDEQYPFQRAIAEMPELEVYRMSERMKIRINARCRDLLETTIYPEEKLFDRYQVDFLHRTVRDFFLETSAIDDILKPELRISFEPSLSLCRMMLALAKTSRGMEHREKRHKSGTQMVRYAAKLETQRMQEHKSPAQMRDALVLLDELQRVWIDPPAGSQSRQLPHEINDRAFLCECIDMGLVFYLRHRLAQEPEIFQGSKGRSYLIHALNGWVEEKFSPAEDEQRDVRVETLQLLLEQQSLDPNAGLKDQTAWDLCIEWLANHHRLMPASVRQCMCDAMKLFLNNGADPTAYFFYSSEEKMCRAISILQRLYPAEATVFEQLAKPSPRKLLTLPASKQQQHRKTSPIRTLMDRFRSKD
jgi:hypothetical protein